MKIDLFYSRLGNSDFVQFPARIAKTPICQGLKKFYESELKEDLLATSNFPKEYSCPWSKVWIRLKKTNKLTEVSFQIMQGKYWVKNFLLDSKKLSHLVMPGLWRAENIFFDKNGEESLVIHTIARAEQGSLLGWFVEMYFVHTLKIYALRLYCTGTRTLITMTL